MFLYLFFEKTTKIDYAGVRTSGRGGGNDDSGSCFEHENGKMKCSYSPLSAFSPISVFFFVLCIGCVFAAWWKCNSAKL